MSTYDSMKNLQARGYAIAMAQVCPSCSGRGVLEDRSSAAYQQTSFGDPLPSLTIRCPSCTNGWLFQLAAPGALEDLLWGVLQERVKTDPQAFLNLFVEATETVVVKGTPQ